MLNVPLQLIAYNVLSVSPIKGGGRTNVSSCSYRLTLREEQLGTQVSTGDTNSTRDIPKFCRILSVDALPSNKSDTQKHSWAQSRKDSAPSMTIFILPTRPWTTPKVCAAVIRASSWVNRSNLPRTASISLSPINFFPNFSVVHWVTGNIRDN